jgi:hypothetical protein
VKICITCGDSKNLSCFTKDKTKPDGLYSICKECLKNKRDKLKEKKRNYDIEYRLKNSIKLSETRKEYQKKIPNEIRAKYNREYRQRHKGEFNRKQLLYIEKNKYRFAYRTVLFNFLTRSKQKKNGSTSSILGYDFNKFKERIEFNFKEGMSWSNYGKWHIDHKKPISKFNENTPANIVNALCNLQPLWAAENLFKGNKFNTKNI